MSYLIEIDKSTIKANPNAGMTHYCMPGAITVEKNEKGEVIEMHRDVIEYASMTPEPEYYYNYLSSNVKCDSCGKEFDHTKLVSDCTYNDDDYSDKVCPHCGEFDCCNIEYEDIKQTI